MEAQAGDHQLAHSGVKQWLAGAVILALTASHGGVAWLAWGRATDKAEARTAAARAALSSDLAKVAGHARQMQAELAQAREDRAAVIEALEHEARRDPGAGDRVPSGDSLRRLETRWGSP